MSTDCDAAGDIAFRQRLRSTSARFPPQDRAARMAGVSRAAWQNYLSGKNVPSFSVVARFARAAGVSLTWLAYGTADAGGIDEDLLVEIVDVIEEGCAMRGDRPSPQRYGRLVAYCYRAAMAEEQVAKPDADAIRRALRLVS